MPRLRYSLRNLTDLEIIWDFIAADSRRRATAVVERLHEKIERLRTQPLAGHRHHELHPEVRCLNSDGYLILYRYSAGIVRIVHHFRDLPALSFDDL